ncbi:hypothetical protein BGZ49_008051 [Haplosporangium sp. Z 27]|nr:hypothetical protein BGZ49_008051 [Haplosporangium sp. Z 27]
MNVILYNVIKIISTVLLPVYVAMKSTGIGLLLQRCGESVLINPYGDPSQYLPDQYTQTPSENPSDKVSKIPIKAIAEDDAEEDDDNGEEGGGGQAEVTTAIAAATTTATTTFIFLTSSSPTVALDPPTNTPVPNDSYNTSRISVAAVVGIILGLMGFLLAVTLITIIVGSKCTGTGSRDIATPDYHHDNDNDHSFGFAAGLPMNVTTSSTLPRTSTAEESWDKIEYDLPVYSDIMANGSSFAAMKEAGIDTQTIPYSRYASDPNNSSSSSSSSNNGSGGGDGYPNSPTSNSPTSNDPSAPDYDHYHDSNADQETISNNMAHNSGSSGSRGDRAA